MTNFSPNPVEPNTPSPAGFGRAHRVLLVAIALGGMVSAFETRISVFALLLLVIGLASLARSDDLHKRWYWRGLLVGLFCTLVGMGRFVWLEALPGIKEARGRDSGKKAVSVLRQILFAQDALRRYGSIDPDGDGIGSAGTLAELSGSTPPRGSATPLPAAPLASRFAPRIPTKTGPATEHEGHLFIVCLPVRSGGFSTYPTDPIDDEQAERRWLAYAWPTRAGLGHSAAYFIDEHEGILESTNLLQSKGESGPGSKLRLVGPEASPACDDALSEHSGASWKPWQGKRPRHRLVGDH